MEIITVKESQMITHSQEIHYKVIINDKEVWVNQWEGFNESGVDAGIEIFKGAELLTEEEHEAVIEYIDDLE